MTRNQNLPVHCISCKSNIIDNIFEVDKNLREIKCNKCNETFVCDKGSVKLINYDSPEEEYYEEKYDLENITKENVNFPNLRKKWFSPLYKRISLKFLRFKSRYIQHNPSDFKDKTILLLGNGVSDKELYFLSLGARIIYTDISHKAVLYVRGKNNFGKFDKNITFQAIDAEEIPLGKESVDFVIGYEFVHHLDDINLFFVDIHRILKKDGVCLFYDASFAPIWQKLKFTLLKPLVDFSHKKSGISPQDLKATYKGGFRKSEIIEVMNNYSFKKYIFYRFGLISILTRRFVIKILGKHKRAMNLLNFLIPKLNYIDEILSRKINFYYNNNCDLFWGFKK